MLIKNPLNSKRSKIKKEAKTLFSSSADEIKMNPFPLPHMKFLTAWTPACRLDRVSKTRTNPPPVSHFSRWHGGGNGSTPTLLKGREKPLLLFRLLSVSPGQQSGISPRGFLGRWRKNPPTQGYKQKAQQSSLLYFHKKSLAKYCYTVGQTSARDLFEMWY